MEFRTDKVAFYKSVDKYYCQTLIESNVNAKSQIQN